MLGMLCEHSAGDAGDVARRREDEPAMIAQIPIGSGRFGPTAERNDLRGTGLPDDVASADPAAAARPGPVDDIPETVAQRLDRPG